MHFIIPPHPREPLSPHDLWTAWNFNLWLLIPLAFVLFIYFLGTRNLWRSAGVGRGIPVWRVLCFLGAVLLLLLALISPLDALAEVLFSAHMVQHLILIMIAAPLLVLSNVPLAFLWALSRPRAQNLGQGLNRTRILSRVWRFLSRPIVAWFLFTIVLWAWHATALYEAALQDEVVHVLEHLIFILTALLFWGVLLNRTTQDHVHHGTAVLYLFTTVLHSGVLGALMTFSDQPWYPYYAAYTPTWGLTPLQDQQIAGLIMWMPGGAVFTLLTIGYFALWMRALEKRSPSQPARKTP